MKWVKPSKKTMDTFDNIMPKGPNIENRKMFGLPVRFINNNMFMGVHGNDIFIRLDKASRGAFLKLKEAVVFEPSPGRAMKEYAVIPEWLLLNVKELGKWIDISLRYVSSLPPKERKKRKR